MRCPMMNQDLPAIPFMNDTCSVRDVFNAHRVRAEQLLDVCGRIYPAWGLRAGDGLSRLWLARAGVPYADDVAYFARAVGRPGVRTLNLSYEWACSTMARNDRAGGVEMFRALDWAIPGMADKLVVARHAGPAGDYLNMAYPGFAGHLQGMAPGRFAIAINRAPFANTARTRMGAWLRSGASFMASRGMPPAFLIRQVFEECRDYGSAVERLSRAPLCVPALFTVAGVNPGEHAVIERLPHEYKIHTNPAAVANHWLNDEWPARDRRHHHTRERLACLLTGHDSFAGNFDWLTAPVLNEDTRLAFEANPRAGTLRVQAFEGARAVTRVLSLG